MRDDCGRLHPRHEVLLEARCRKSKWHVFAVELADISEGGCCFAGAAEDFVPAQRVALRMAHLKAIEAEVRWISGGRVGLVFLTPLSREAIDDLARHYGIPSERQWR
ncbi:MAG: pilus assembly protein PilZ [Novosphingobium lindaniclasticum]|uniref:PilZ domain-containing protein n=1 Tax=Novosphingobium lindaniclasticum TaxID=1329895 RepID=UPI00240A2B9A|nr:PilZ domain-containing protein [Novosphingobium lindaniclasticum]MDF2639769.1 pilus assembly protein PilZ [Novosphingobium lindaniclasticum]